MSQVTVVHAALRGDMGDNLGAPTSTLTDWRFERRVVSLGEAVLSTTRDVLIAGLARGVVGAWRLARRPNVNASCWLGAVARCFPQRLCKRCSANQCVATLAIRPASLRKKGMADAVRSRILFGLRLAPLALSNRRRRLGNITRRAVRRAGTSHFACTNGGVRSNAASDHSAQLSWLCPAELWPAIADWRLEQAPVTARSSCPSHKGCGVSKVLLRVAFCTNTWDGRSLSTLRLGPRNGQVRPLGQGVLATRRDVQFDGLLWVVLREHGRQL